MTEKLLDEREDIYARIFRDHPFKNNTRNADEILNEIVNNITFKNTFDLR